MVGRLGRLFFAGALALSIPALSLYGRAWHIRDIAIEHCGDCEFRRLAHFFSDSTFRFRHGVGRSDENRTTGLYAITFLNGPVCRLPRDSTFSFEFLLAGDPQMHSASGPFGDMRRRSRELWIGLTDERWERLAAADLLAWRITIRSGGGVLCSRQSFLFPDANSKAANGLATGGELRQEGGGER
jgi:hypothetical protein